MRKIKEFPSFTATKHRFAVSIAFALSLAALLAAFGCQKKTIKVQVPKGIREAKTAGFDELAELIRRYDRINTLSCVDLDLIFTSLRKASIGEIERFHNLHGHILLMRPDSFRLVLRIPILNSTLADVLSVGDKLSAWSPREHKFYEGKNSAKHLVVEDPTGNKELSIPRGTHIFEAILPQGAGTGDLVSLDEQRDATTSYYVLTFSRHGTAPRIHTVRKIWIERGGLTIARQQIFEEDGSMASDIGYSKNVQIEGISFPLQMHIDRPADGYSLDLRFSAWRVNPELGEDAFILQPHPDDQMIPLKEKKQNSGS
jgi:hypothetical protein